MVGIGPELATLVPVALTPRRILQHLDVNSGLNAQPLARPLIGRGTIGRQAAETTHLMCGSK